MRCASAVAFGLLGLLVALAPAQEKTPPAPPPEKPSKPKTFSPGEEIEGKNLDGWASDLQHSDPSVREKALSIVPAYGIHASPLVKNIVSYARHDEDLGPKVKAIAALGVMELDKDDEPKVIALLADVLNNREEQIVAKVAAALSLSRFGDEAKERATPALISGVNDRGSWKIRKASVIALRRIGGNKKDGPDPNATKSLLFLAKREPAKDVRLEAIQALGYMDQPHDKKLLDTVRETLKDLTFINDQSHADEKIRAMWAHVSLMALDKVTDDGVKQITKHLASPELEVRGQALLCIGTLGEKAPMCVPDLIKMLKDKDMGIALTACWALVSIGDKDAKVFDAMKALHDNKDTEERAREQIRAAMDALKNRKKTEKNEFVVPKDGDKPADKPPVKPMPK